jgi:FixJ family two-component response regulator
MRAIAVIDDDLRVLESLQNLLASCGHKAVTYSSAELFLTSGGLSQTDCIIADVGMRRIGGLELLQRIRTSQCGVPIIIITGKPSARPEAFYLGEGANGFFRKPIDGQALVGLIDDLITRLSSGHCKHRSTNHVYVSGSGEPKKE